MVLTGRRAVALPSDGEVALLRRFLRSGGTLFVDNSESNLSGDRGAASAFEHSIKAYLSKLLPSDPLKEIPRDHVLYKSFYLLDSPAGLTRTRPYLEGIELNKRLAVISSQNNFLGAFARDDLGTWSHEMDGRAREMSFRFGVNLVMYALCLDYKDDQVHLPFILRKRKI